MSVPLIRFGKYAGQSAACLEKDLGYKKWLKRQFDKDEQFRNRNKKLYKYVNDLPTAKYVFEKSRKMFETQPEIKRYFRDNIEQCLDVVIDENHWFFAFMTDLFNRHPIIEERAVAFFVATCETEDILFIIPLSRTERYRAFYRTKSDGPWIDFSVQKCVSGKDHSRRQILNKAYRNEVMDQIQSVRNNGLTCNSCGTDSGRFDVDHMGKTFSQLLAEFQEQFGTSETLRRVGPLDHFADEEYAQRWKDFHREHASLQYLCTHCHKKKTFNW